MCVDVAAVHEHAEMAQALLCSCCTHMLQASIRTCQFPTCPNSHSLAHVLPAHLGKGAVPKLALV